MGATFAAGSTVLGGGAGLGAAIGAGVLSSTLGSVAGQAFGIASGMQRDFNWQSVALSALSGGVGGGLGALANGAGALSGNTWGMTMARAAIGNALTQGIAVVTGLQESFNWTSVAASAIGAGVGQAVGYGMNSALGTTDLHPLALRTLTGLAAGTATALARGGRVEIQQIATDAFGQALGNSLAEQAMMGGTQEDRLGGFIEQNQPAWEQRQAYNDQIVGAFNQDYSGNRYSGVQMADASGRLTLSNARSSDEAYFGNIIDTQQARDRNIARMMDLANQPQAMGYALSASAGGRATGSIGNVDMSPTIANAERLGLMGPDGQTEGAWCSPVRQLNLVGVPLPPLGTSVMGPSLPEIELQQRYAGGVTQAVSMGWKEAFNSDNSIGQRLIYGGLACCRRRIFDPPAEISQIQPRTSKSLQRMGLRIIGVDHFIIRAWVNIVSAATHVPWAALQRATPPIIRS